MRRVLLDEGVPVGVRAFLADYEVRTIPDPGWAGLSNGAVIAAAEAARFDVLATCDQNIRYQQNLSGRRLALIRAHDESLGDNPGEPSARC